MRVWLQYLLLLLIGDIYYSTFVQRVVVGASPNVEPTVGPTPKPTVRPPTYRPTFSPSQYPTAKPTRPPTPHDPQLLSFDFDNDGAILTLYFDSLVAADTLDTTKINLQGVGRISVNANGTALPFPKFTFGLPYNDLTAQGNTTYITVVMTQDDYALLTIISHLATEVSNTWLTIQRGAVYSPDGFANRAINSSNPLGVSSFTPHIQPPYVLFFNYDHNAGYLAITFSSPMDNNTFQLKGIAIQNQRNAYSSGLYVRLVNEGYTIVNITNYQRTFTVLLGYENMNAIKSQYGLATTAGTTYLSMWQSFVNDTWGIPLQYILNENLMGMAVTHYTPDTTPPTLLYWDYNKDVGSVILTFSKPVMTSYFNYSCVVLVSTATITNETYEFRLGASSYASTAIVASFEIFLTEDEINILSNYDIVIGLWDSFLVLEYGAVVDSSPAQNVYQGNDATFAHPLQARLFYPDLTQPILQAATVNMTSQIMTFTFSKNFRLSTLSLTQLVLQSAAATSTTSEAITLSSSLVHLLTTQDGKFFAFQFTPTTFNVLKLSKFLYRAQSRSFVAFSASLLQDKAVPPHSAVPISTANAFKVTSYYPDYVPPTLVTFYMDMSYDILVLIFSEPMDLSTIDVTAITLSSAASTVGSTVSYTLSSDSYVKNFYMTKIYIQLSKMDAVNVKSSPPLCTNFAHCFISIASSFGYDVSTVSATGVTVHNALLPVKFVLASSSLFIVDVVRPQLLSYNLDMTKRTLFMQFSEPVMAQNLDSSGFVFYGNPPRSRSYRLSRYSTTHDSNSLNVTLAFTRSDFLQLKSAYIASNISEVFLEIESKAITDIAGNPVNGSDGYVTINGLKLKTPTAFEPDYSQPSISAVYFFDPHRRNLTVYFDDLISFERLQPEAISIAASVGSKTTLQNAIVSASSTHPYVVQFDLGPMETTLVSMAIAGSQSRTLVYPFSAGAFFSFPNGLPNAASTVTQAVREGIVLLSFRLNLNAGLILIETVFTVGIASIDMTQITVQSTTSSAGVSLTTLETFSTSSDNFIQIQLSDGTLANIVGNVPIKGISSISLAVAQNAIVDVNSKTLSTTSNLPCSQVVLNTKKPYLVSFTLDMGVGYLNLVFSTTMDVSTVNLPSLTLTNRPSNSTRELNLGTALVLTPSGTPSVNLLISLNNGGYPTLRDQLHLYRDLGTSAHNTYLAIGDGFIADTLVPPNYVQPISLQNATKVLVFTADSTAPTLVSFTLDMTARKLRATYSEAVNSSTNHPGFYLLASNPNNPSSAQIYLSTSNTSHLFGNTVEINISPTDQFNINIQAPNLATKRTNSYLSIKTGAVTDISPQANNQQGILFLYAVAPLVFVPDTRPPQLKRFDLSIQESTLTLYFQKAIDCYSAALSYFQFQFATFLGTSSEFYGLNASQADCSQTRYETTVFVDIHIADLIAMKAFPSVFKSASTTYLRPLQDAIFDANGNGILPVPDGVALQVSKFETDTVPPYIVSFTITSAKVLVLYFSEPVNPKTFTISEITFQSSLPPFANSYALSAAQLLATSANKMVYQVSLLADYTKIAANSIIFNIQSGTFLSCTSSLVQDMYGNPLTPVPKSAAIQLGPSIIAWDIDMNTGVMRIQFSEAVNSSFSFRSISFQAVRHFLPGNNTYTLTTSTKVASTGSTGTTFVSTLSLQDLNSLRYYGVASSARTAYIAVPFGLTRSILSSTLLPYLRTVQILPSTALPVRTFKRDVTPPKCLYFDLNLNSGQVLVTFDKPVLPQSLSLTGLTLLSSELGTSVTLTETNRDVTITNLTTIVVNVNRHDLDSIKIANKAGLLNNLLLAGGSLLDFSGNVFAGVSESNPIYISHFIPDTSPPRFTNFTLNLAAGTMTLYFDEVVEVSSINPSNIVVMSTANDLITGNYAATVRLTNATLFALTSDENVIVDMASYVYDYDAIEANNFLGFTTQDTFLYVAGIRDLAGNLVVPTVRQASTVIADTSAPVLLSFDFILHTSYVDITLYFSKRILISTFICADFELLSDPSSNARQTILLSNSQCTVITTDSSYVVEFKVTPASQFTLIGSSATTTWLAVPSVGATTDIYQNQLAAMPAIKAIQVGPQVIKCFLDMNAFKLTLIFSRSISTTVSFNSSDLGFYSKVTSGSSYLSGNGSVLHFIDFGDNTADATSAASVSITPFQMDNLKLIDVRVGSLYLLVRGPAVYEPGSTVGLANIPLSRALPFTSIAADTVRPVIKSLALDMGSDILSIYFSEPIRVSSIKVFQLVLQASNSSAAISYKLTGGTILQTKDLIQLTMLPADAGKIKLNDHLCKSISTSFLSFAFKTAADYAGNYLATVKTTAALPMNSYTADAVEPMLLSYDLDMNSQIMTIRFSEPVLNSSIQISEFTISSRFSLRDGTSYVLTSARLLDPSGLTIRFLISDFDIIQIKSTAGLARNKATTFVLFTSYFARDLAGNPIVAITDGNALPVSTFSPDVTPPTVLKSTMDVDTAKLTFLMSEPIQLSLVDVSGVTFKLGAFSSTSYTLTQLSSVYASAEFSATIEIDIAPVDMNILKYLYPLVSSRNETWLSLSSTFLVDVFNNPLKATLSAVDSFIPEIAPPALVSYGLDMNKGLISLVFSESIKASSVDPTQLTIQTTPTRRFGQSRTLGSSVPSVGTFADAVKVSLTISASELIYMKFYGIGSTIAQSLLSWTDSFLQDESFHYTPPKYDASIAGYTPLTPNTFSADTSGSVLQRWQIDRTNIGLILFFDEPVKLVNASYISLFVGQPVIPLIGPVLGGFTLGAVYAGVEYSDFNTRVNILLTNTCPDAWVGGTTGLSCPSSSFFSILNDTSKVIYLTMSAGAFTDFALVPNPSIVVTTSNAAREGEPECGACPAGYYTSTPCAAFTDRICTICSTCTTGKYAKEPCGGTRDVQCTLCSTCSYGTYISTPCAGSQNTVCSPCTVCTASQYPSQQCTGGVDTVCESCLSCTFAQDAIKKYCVVGHYLWWYLNHCCYDKLGNTAPCLDVDLANLIIDTRDARLHWTFAGTTNPGTPITYPQILGAQYAVGMKYNN